MKTCIMCGAQNEDAFTRCATCGADLPSPNGETGDDEKTVLIDPSETAKTQPKSGLSLKTDESAYGQETAQPGFGGQMPYQQPMQQAQPGFGGQMPYQQPVQQAQPKAKKGMIIGILAGAAVVLAVAFLLIFNVFGSKSGGNSPENVIRQCMDAMNDSDVDKLKDSYAPFVVSSEDFDEIESAMELLEAYNAEYTVESIDGQTDYTDSEIADLEDDISLYYDTEVSLDDACEIDVTYNVSVSMLGESYDESESNTFTCVKYKGNWYIYE